ncbi:sensor histidine kinase [Cellvibrio zantedeschiae]|uniref:histidine kinase n=1 Tax=Cellvibrio zantedeschiae TaxID=1237077 RepID=A0ABQ3AQL1_9GAMM|nr:two-component system sensor histidine kinase CreC [Cellvibrio zantedeschiae]GGY64207.1 sensor histidine kinase [Cellvibrio zantedeschiae]
MSLSIRIFLVYLVFVGLSGYFILNTVVEEIKPGVRQSTEETLVDTANLLAEILREPVKNQTLQNSDFPQILAAYGRRKLQANIWGIDKTVVNHRIYVTDKKGIVILDSAHKALGQDYSHWNDVYLTLHGKYGARSTAEIPDDVASSVMYIGAPIMDGDDIIGVVSVAKPNRSMQPFIDRSRNRLALLGGIIITIGLLAGILFSWWLTAELRRLRNYALAVSAGERAVLPEQKIASGELNQLANALESMRIELDGKAYIEQYVQTLAHELKSPLAGIHAAAELLQSPMSEEQRERFINNIAVESVRMQQLIERLLNLALVEQQQALHETKAVAIKSLWNELVEAQSARMHQHNISCVNDIAEDATLTGEVFLLRQAFANLLENALDFTPKNGRIRIFSERQNGKLKITIENEGEPIPEFAFARLTERFYSLPRPSTGKKSTGLGLNFVQEVASLHKGELQLRNTEGGVEASLIF